MNLKVSVNTICDFQILFGDFEGIILKNCEFQIKSCEFEGNC